jgi:hypothetical protein
MGTLHIRGNSYIRIMLKTYVNDIKNSEFFKYKLIFKIRFHEFSSVGITLHIYMG